MILSVDKNLSEWRANNDIIEKHTEFRKFSGIEQYISGDSANFNEIDSYADLLSDMATLIADEIEISEISSEIMDKNWYFEFSVDGIPLTFSMPDPDTDLMSKDFIKSINTLLELFTSKRFRSVFPTGIENVDQRFDIAFIDNETLYKLLQHEYSFAEETDDEE